MCIPAVPNDREADKQGPSHGVPLDMPLNDGLSLSQNTCRVMNGCAIIEGLGAVSQTERPSRPTQSRSDGLDSILSINNSHWGTTAVKSSVTHHSLRPVQTDNSHTETHDSSFIYNARKYVRESVNASACFAINTTKNKHFLQKLGQAVGIDTHNFSASWGGPAANNAPWQPFLGEAAPRRRLARPLHASRGQPAQLRKGEAHGRLRRRQKHLYVAVGGLLSVRTE